MKLEKPENSNYCAVVVKIKNIILLENCDNVVATTVFGYQAIIGKNFSKNDMVLFFPAETQLSEEYTRRNNLFRHNELNDDSTQKGYIEDNRRVRAVKFRGNRSDCLIMPLDSVSYTGVDVEKFIEGDEFEKLENFEICKKFVLPVKNRDTSQLSQKPKSRVDKIFMPEHYDTENYFKMSPMFPKDTDVIVTQKLHGTSIRIGNTIVNRKLTLLERLAEKIGVKVQKTEFDYIYGSRKVIKDPNNPNQNHFYEEDIWTEEGKKLVGLLPKNFLVFAELVGWTSTGSAIQADYTYGVELGKAELYVYRIAIVNDDGVLHDLTWDQTVEFCNTRGLKHVAEIWRGKLKNFKVEKYLDIRYRETLKNTKDAMVWLGDNDVVDEGVVVKLETNIPIYLKAKAPKFLEHETKILDTGEVDLETDQSVI